MRILHSIALFILVTGWVGTAAGDEPARLFLNGIQAYNEGDYEAAIDTFTRLADSGVKNGKLYYNLGNTFLKSGDIGPAVLWYERAQRLIPDDPDLNFNLTYARSLIEDDPEKQGAPILRILFFWKYILSAATIQWIAVSLNFMFWGLMAVRLFHPRFSPPSVRYATLGLTIIFSLTAFFNYYEMKYVREAVVLHEKASVRSGLTPDSTELFVLHAGTKVRVDKENSGFFRIRFTDDKIGWIAKAELGVI